MSGIRVKLCDEGLGWDFSKTCEIKLGLEVSISWIMDEGTGKGHVMCKGRPGDGNRRRKRRLSMMEAEIK